MLYENVQIQLVDLPPLSAEFMEPWLPQVIRNADAGLLLVDAEDAAVLDEIEFIAETLGRWRVPAPRLLVGNKMDRPGATQNFSALEELYAGRYRCVGVSALAGEGLDRLRRELFDLLSLVRVYTKAPGKKADLNSPYVLRRGQTVLDAARMVHQEFAARLKFARLFRVSGGHDGQMVERHHLVQDEDILEFHV